MSGTEQDWEEFVPKKKISDAAPESKMAQLEAIVRRALTKAFTNGSQHPAEVSHAASEAAMLYAFTCSATIRQPFTLTGEQATSMRDKAMNVAKRSSGLEGASLAIFEKALPVIAKEAESLVVPMGHGWGASK